MTQQLTRNSYPTFARFCRSFFAGNLTIATPVINPACVLAGSELFCGLRA
jgi:hypothetical protein